MEPANLNPHSEPDAELETLLQRTPPPLADDGFSARVVAALPAKSRTTRGRFWVGMTGAVTGAVFAFTRGASWPALRESGQEIDHLIREVSALAGNPCFMLALVVAALSLHYVFRPGDSASGATLRPTKKPTGIRSACS